MEKKIKKSLDNLSVEETSKLLLDETELKMSDRKKRKIKKAVYKKTEQKPKEGFFTSKKLAACGLALAIVFLSMSIVGFGRVGAAIKNVFTFIPGFGIETEAKEVIYTAAPLKKQVKASGITAGIVHAVYSDGYLSATVEVNKTSKNGNLGIPHYDDFKLIINGEEKDFLKAPSNSNLAWSENSAMLFISYKTTAPTADDVFEIEINGFTERLSFKMKECESYSDISKIGPTEIRNGISITTSSEIIDDKLVIWCYPYKIATTLKDSIVGIGQPANGSYEKERYVETEKGRLTPVTDGWSIRNRLVYNISANHKSAVLHIPYLAMYREESKKLKVTLPSGHTELESGKTLKTSLGKIKVEKVVRTQNEYDKNKDTVYIYFAFEGINDIVRPYSFNYTVGKDTSGAYHFDAKTGSLDYIEFSVSKNQKSVTLDISGIYYYILDEYVIPLDIK